MRDLFNRVKLARSLDPAAAVTDNTAQVGQIVDHAGYESAIYVIDTGVLTDVDAVFSVKVEEGDNAALSDAANVAAADLQIDPLLAATPAALHQAAFDFASDNKQIKIGYKGFKRYTRVTITPANNTGNLFASIVAVLGGARHMPAGATQVP